MNMYYKIRETDESIDDLSRIAFNAYDYTRDKKSGENVFEEYDITVNGLKTFPMGYRGISIEHRGYEIHILPFSNYNLFFIVNENVKVITVLRVLYQKQNWAQILRIEDVYHIRGKAI